MTWQSMIDVLEEKQETTSDEFRKLKCIDYIYC